ncbi:MAG: hypothetical protein U1A77_07350 [Pirellulales bacterium]
MTRVLFQHVEARLDRYGAVAPTFVVSAAAAFMGFNLLCRFVLLADWPHQERSRLALLPVPVVTLIASWLHYRLRVYGITLTSTSLQLHSDWRGVVIPTTELIGVVGMPGLDLHEFSGDIIQWKKLLLITTEKSLQISLPLPQMMELYQAIVFLCPWMIGVPYPPKLISHPVNFANVWPRFLQVTRRVARRRSLLGMSIIGGMVLATPGVMLASNADSAGKAAVLAFIFILEGAGILSSGRTLYRTLDTLRNRMF